MDIRTAFGSYLKAADITAAGGTVRLRIREFGMAKLKNKDGEEEEKPVLYFDRTEKGLILNKTNCDAIAATHGWETDEWTGKTVELYVKEVEAFGKMQDAIRVRVPKQSAPTKPQPRRQTEPMQSETEDEPPPIGDEDEPPF